MRRTALIAAVLVLAACRTTPEVKVPEKVYIEVEKIVDVPEELTRDCDSVPKKSATYGEAVRLANARKASLDECTGRMRQIRDLK